MLVSQIKMVSPHGHSSAEGPYLIFFFLASYLHVICSDAARFSGGTNTGLSHYKQTFLKKSARLDVRISWSFPPSRDWESPKYLHGSRVWHDQSKMLSLIAMYARSWEHVEQTTKPGCTPRFKTGRWHPVSTTPGQEILGTDNCKTL